jgi:hypothetical protein
MSEQWFVVIDTSGECRSLGTRVADPLPNGLRAVALAPEDAKALLEGRAAWSAALLCVVPRPEEVPEYVTPWQFFTWLWQNKGVTETQIREMLAALPVAQRVQAEIDIDRAASFRRAHPLLTQFGAALGMTEPEIDDAFKAMAKLTGAQE